MEENVEIKIRRYFKLLAALMMIFMAGYPFITYFHVEEPTGKALQYFAKKSRYIIDFFQYQKEATLILFAVMMLIFVAAGVLIYRIVAERWPFHVYVEKAALVSMLGYLWLNVISCLVSEYRADTFMGMCLEYEGLAAVAGYVILFFLGYILFAGEETRKILETGILALAALIVAGAALECFLGPLADLGSVQSWITPDRYRHLLENVEIGYGKMLSLSFANPGYLGGVCALLMPVVWGMAVVRTALPEKIFCCVLVGGLGFTMIMTGSTGPVYAVAAVLIIESAVLIITRSFSLAGLAKALVLSVVSAACFLLVISLSGRYSLSDITAKTIGSVTNPQFEKTSGLYPVEKIRLEDGKLCVDSKDSGFCVEVLADEKELRPTDIRITDQEDNEIPVWKTGEGHIRLDEPYEPASINVAGKKLSIDLGYDDPVEFYCHEGRLYYIDFNGSLLPEIPQPKLRGMERFYSLFTGRGYIWISSIPILKEVLLIGKGIGTFPFYFPQSEVAGMLNTHGSADYCIEIAHSWYLQTAVNSGILSLLCVLCLFGVHLFRGLKSCAKDKDMATDCTRLLFWGVLAFQITGLVNNSCITVSPVFWILFGCSMRSLKRCSERPLNGGEIKC